MFGEREIAKDIFAFLDARSLVAASEVCVCWSAIESIESEELWGSLCMVDYHVSPAALVSVKKKKKKKEQESLTAKDLYKTSVKRLGALTRILRRSFRRTSLVWIDTAALETVKRLSIMKILKIVSHEHTNKEKCCG